MQDAILVKINLLFTDNGMTGSSDLQLGGRHRFGFQKLRAYALKFIPNVTGNLPSLYSVSTPMI